MYRFINAEGTAVVHLLTSRCIYLDQPVTVHSEAYLAWVAEGNAADSYVAPPVTPVDRKPIVIAALAEIDAKSIRPLRSGDADYLASLEAQALALRAELATL